MREPGFVALDMEYTYERNALIESKSPMGSGEIETRIEDVGGIRRWGWVECWFC